MKTLFLIFWLVPIFIFSQEEDSTSMPNITYRIAAEYGKIAATNFYIKALETPKRYTAFSFELKKKTNGEKKWQREFGNPSFGFGLFGASLGEDRHLGNPLAIYGVFQNEFKKTSHWEWEYFIRMGIGFGAHPFQAGVYPNPTFGSKTNMYIALGTLFQYHLGDYFDAGLGLAFNHLSNGSTHSPNKGLNFFAPQFSLTYHPKIVIPSEKNDKNLNDNQDQNKKIVEAAFFYAKKHVFYRGAGRETLENVYDGKQYNVYGLEVNYFHSLTYKSSFGIGIGVAYDENYDTTMYVDNGNLYEKKRFPNPHFLYHIVPTYRLKIDRFSVNIGLGYYPLKQKNSEDDFRFFQRLGLQYQLTNKIFASFGINAYDFHRANFLEWKLGYLIF